MQATKAKQIAPPITLRSAQALDDLSGYSHQACCCISIEVAVAMQSVMPMDGPSSCHILWSPQRLGLNSLDLLTSDMSLELQSVRELTT